MSINFLIKALSKNQFDGLMKLTDKELANKHAKWITVDESPGYPCRVSLTEAAVGERVLALPPAGPGAGIASRRIWGCRSRDRQDGFFHAAGCVA